MATVVAVFSQQDRAEQAVRALRDQGFDQEISIAAKGDDKGGPGRQDGGQDDGQGGGGGRQNFEAGGDMGMTSENVADGTTWGSALGGAAGLLAGAGALAIPGVGPIIAAGPLAAALSGVAAGGVAGGLVDMGIPEQEGKRYEEDIKQGKVLATVESDRKKVEQAQSTLRENGADEVKVYEKGEGSNRSQ